MVGAKKSSSTRTADPKDPRAFATVVGESIRHGRHALGWTQVELAEAAGLSANYIARLERGELSPSLLVATQICRALDVEVTALLVAPAPAKKAGKRR